MGTGQATNILCKRNELQKKLPGARGRQPGKKRLHSYAHDSSIWVYSAPMLMIVAALEEELRLARDLCAGCTRLPSQKLKIWEAGTAGRTILFLKTGVGPRAATTKLVAAIKEVKPSRILVVGYSGALDPGLKVGDLIAVRRAFLLGGNEPLGTPLEAMTPGDMLDLSLENLKDGICRGDVVTTPFIIGEQAQKALLHAKFGAFAVDMETAAFALAARSAGIPLGCVRAITDTADDEFLAPVSYDPDSSTGKRVFRVVTAGKWVQRYRDWTERATIARRSLHAFLAEYLPAWKESQ
jgi:adenosylhomocysteine nucleosidase